MFNRSTHALSSLGCLLAATLLSTIAGCATSEDAVEPDDLDPVTEAALADEAASSTETAAETAARIANAQLAVPRKKWHPGHYVNGYWGTSLSHSLGIATKDPFFAGIEVSHTWRELEPQKGRYDFSRIRAELAAARAAHKQVLIQIWDKHYKTPDCVPDYLLTDPQYQGGKSVLYVTVKDKNTGKDVQAFRGCTALRWVPAVQDRLIALYTAMGREFDADPNLEAVMLQEDSFTRGGTHYDTYNKRAYADQQKRGMTALAQAFPRTQVIKFLNWGPYIGELFAHAHALGLAVGGPDIFPEDPTWAYPFYQQYAGRMPLQISMQWPAPRKDLQSGKTTLEQMFNFAVTDKVGLHVNYVIWDQPEEPALSFQKQIRPLLRARNGKINTGCPANIICN